MSNDFNKSFNPMCEPSEDRQCKFDESPEPERRGMNFEADHIVDGAGGSCRTSRKDEKDFTFPCGQSVSEDDDEVTESKIRAFIDEKALELKRMQTPLFEDYYNTLNGSIPLCALRNIHDDNNASYLKLPPKSRSLGRGIGGTPPVPSNAAITTSPGSSSRRESSFGVMDNKNLQGIPLPQLSEWRGLIDSQQQPLNPSASFSERQRKWKKELERKRAFQGMQSQQCNERKPLPTSMPYLPQQQQVPSHSMHNTIASAGVQSTSLPSPLSYGTSLMDTTVSNGAGQSCNMLQSLTGYSTAQCVPSNIFASSQKMQVRQHANPMVVQQQFICSQQLQNQIAKQMQYGASIIQPQINHNYQQLHQQTIQQTSQLQSSQQSFVQAPPNLYSTQPSLHQTTRYFAQSSADSVHQQKSADFWSVESKRTSAKFTVHQATTGQSVLKHELQGVESGLKKLELSIDSTTVFKKVNLGWKRNFLLSMLCIIFLLLLTMSEYQGSSCSTKRSCSFGKSS